MKKQKSTYAGAIATNSAMQCSFENCTRHRERLHRYCTQHVRKLIRYGSPSGNMILAKDYLSRYEDEITRLVDLNASKAIVIDTLDAIAGIREKILLHPPSQPGVKQLDYFASHKQFDPKKILIHVACLYILLKEEPFLYPIFTDEHQSHWIGFSALRTIPRERIFSKTVKTKRAKSGYDVAWILTTKVWLGSEVWERAGRLLLMLHRAYRKAQKGEQQ